MASPQQTPRPQPFTRALRLFWLLVAGVVVATGSLTSALTAPPSPVTGLRVAVSGLVATAAVILATRVMIALDRARRQARLAAELSDAPRGSSPARPVPSGPGTRWPRRPARR